jgi:hypothetical protein
MIPPNLLARLAGAQPDVLDRARTDRIKFTAMGGVLLTTAGVAGVSAAFALSTAVGLPFATAVVAGALWALVIFNLDRMLIVSMVRQSGWLRNVLTAIPRVALAVVIGTVISVPLVLRIFQPEINNLLQVMHSENLIVNQRKLNDQYADIGPLQQKVEQLQGVASGQTQPSVSSDPDVAAAQAEVDSAQKAFDTADAAAQCELVGSCGSNVPGMGEAYWQAKAKAVEANTALGDAKSQLSEVENTVRTRIADSVTTNRADARQQLTTLVPDLQKRQADRTAAQARLDNGEESNEGLLARLQALDRLSAGQSSMAAANLALFLLFLFIELLPVLVKLLSMTGKPTLYDRLLQQEESKLEKRAANLQTRAMANDEILVQLELDRTAQQLVKGKEANTLLVQEQSKIAARSIEVWAAVAMERSEDELARWYAHHSTATRQSAPHPAAQRTGTPGQPTPPAPPGASTGAAGHVDQSKAAAAAGPGGPRGYQRHKAGVTNGAILAGPPFSTPLPPTGCTAPAT